MRILRSTARGEAFVHIMVEIPVKLNKEEAEILRKFDEQVDETTSPQTTNFFKKVKDLFS